MEKLSSAIIISPIKDAYYNLAIERLFISANFNFPIMFLWQSQNAVVIGAHQNPFAECNLQKMEQDGVQLTRRATGGGAVYHDEGNLNFCFIQPKKNANKNANFQIVLSALKSLSISAQLNGRNDVTVNGFKVSGSAYYDGSNVSLHHGTLLISSNLNALATYLTPRPEKLLKNGVKSVRSRVCNLREFNPQITVELMKNALIDAFSSANGGAEILRVENFFKPSEINGEREYICSNQYLFSKWENFNAKVSKNFEWGFCTIDLSLNAFGEICSLIAESDTLFAKELGAVISQLKGKKLSEIQNLPNFSGQTAIIYKEIANLLINKLNV